MERRTRNKNNASTDHDVQVAKSKNKISKSIEKTQKKQSQLHQQRYKENIMFSLANAFLQSQNKPDYIYPWMSGFSQLQERIIGTNYIIIGPSQSGKYSAVRYALGKFHTDVQEIIVNCEITTTEYQFINKLLKQFRSKCPRASWPKEQKQINQLIVSENIQFSRLDRYIIEKNFKFVIVIKNGEHLVGFKKQSILYNLFEWMNSEEIKKRAGLVILSRQLLLTDRFEKRIKSRFCGNRLCIFRPEDPQIYIKILCKRVDAVIEDTKTWAKNFKNSVSTKIQEQQQKKFQAQMDIEDEERTRIKRHSTKVCKAKTQQQQLLQFYQSLSKYQQTKFIKELNSYFDTLKSYMSYSRIKELGIDKYFIERVKKFERQQLSSKKQEDMHVFYDNTILTSEEKVQNLRKLKTAIEKNQQMKFFFKNKILQNQVITIPFVLRLFQHVFMTIDQGLLKYLPLESLKQLLLIFLKKNVEHQFPINVIQTHSLQSFNSVELLLLILILRMIEEGKQYPVKLTKIYDKYKSNLNRQIYASNDDRTSNKFPIKIIERSLDRLAKNNTISFNPLNIWNSEITLHYEKVKVKKGLDNLSNRGKLSDMLMDQLKELNNAQRNKNKNG